MRPGVLSRSIPKKLLLWSAPLAWLGCGGGSTDVVLPSLSVTTATQGVELDPDGYSLLVDGDQGRPIGLQATLIVERLSDGEHSLELSGLASNCTAQGENPRSVTVTAGATTSSAFAVSCSATSGTLQVATATSGSGSDPDGFTLLLDGSDRGSIGISATMSLPGLAAGDHLIGLTGLAANCQVVGENPRSVTVTLGQAAQVSFAVTCAAPPPSTGTLEITTATSGSDQDPDGYSLSVDGGTSQPIGLNASLALSSISAAQHTVQLIDVAANCTVAGANPRQATVPAGGSISVAFVINCVAPPPGTGSVQITAATSGSSLDPDGYTISVDGGSTQSIGINGSRTIDDLPAGPHSVQLGGLATNCTAGDNPRAVTVTAEQTTAVSFEITCAPLPPTTGSIQVTAATSGSALDPDGYAASVDGGNARTLTINGSRTFGDLTPGSHSVRLSGLATNCSVSGDNPRAVTVTAGQTASITFAVTCVAIGPSINLRIERLYLTQSTQTLTGDVPLVQDRDAFIRVFVTANESNTARPSVRVRLFRNTTLVSTLTILATEGSTPTGVQEGTLSRSWNVRVPASILQPGLAVLADVDPTDEIAETNESDNSFPGSGTPRQLTVLSVPTAAVRFVPVLQSSNGLQGSVGSTDGMMQQAVRMYPLQAIQTDLHALYTTDEVLEADGTGWGQVLNDIEGMRVAEGSNRTYYGVVKVNYTNGLVGLGFVGDLSTNSTRAAMGWDNPSDARRVVAHELGHTWGQLHAPCGNPPPATVDPGYPYANGAIGVYGYDATSGTLKSPSLPDIMGYCPDPWVSDYTYQRVLTFRRSQAAASAVAAVVQPCLLVWGRIEDGRPVLEPAFHIVTRPSLPVRPGPYSVEAVAADGTSLFRISFDATPIADDPRAGRLFAFAVPLDQARAARLGSVRLTAAGAQVAVMSQSAAQLPRRAPPADVVAQREAGAVALKWNAAAHPMIMVRDPDSGEVLSFARGGLARLRTGKGELDLEVSDGVQSHRVRLAINR